MRRALVALAATAAVVLGTPVAAAAGEGDGTQVAVERIAGADRYATAAAVAKAAFPEGAPAAVLARGDLFPDALAGSHLAGAVDGPVLLTTSASLHPQARSALDALGADRVYVLGGTGAISEAVADAVRATGRQVTRVAGQDRYATAAAAAAAAGEVGVLDGGRTALLASGAGFADALAAGPLAAAEGFPLLLTPPTQLAAATAQALAARDVEHVVVLGGTAAVSDEVVAAVEAEGRTTERVAGDDRAATAAAIADLAVERLGWTGDHVLLARQDDFPDGLAAGPLGAVRHAPVLLSTVDPLTPVTAGWLEANQATVAAVTAVGGTAAIADATLAAARVAAGHVDLAAFRVEGAEASAALGATRTCTVAAPAGQVVHLRLLPADDVTADPLALRDDDAPTGVADQRPVRATFTSVGGRQVTPSAAVNDLTLSGPTEVGITSTEYDRVVLVAFSDGADGTARALDVDTAGVPTEEAAAGCRTMFAPPDALQGLHQVVVHVVDVAGGVFLGSDQTRRFHWTDADEFVLGETTIDRTRFEALLSRGDAVAADYRMGEGGTSTFTVTSDTVTAAPAPTLLATTLDGGDTSNDVQVTFTVPPHNGAGTRYRVVRQQTEVGSSGCTSSIAAPEAVAATVERSPHGDLNVSSTGECFKYRIVTLSSEGLVVVGPYSSPVKVPGPPPVHDTKRPTSVHAQVTNGTGAPGTLDAGDVVEIAFDEPLAAPASGASITLESGATITSGSGATFSLNDSSVTLGGASRGPGTVLRITIGTSPSPSTALPAQITQQSGIADPSGNPWDINASPQSRLDP